MESGLIPCTFTEKKIKICERDVRTMKREKDVEGSVIKGYENSKYVPARP